MRKKIPSCSNSAWEALRRDCLNITSAQKWHSDILKFLQKNFPDLIKEISCTYVTWFLLITAPKLYKNLEEPFCQAGKLFSAKIWKLASCHFWAIVMLRQSRLRATRASPAKRLQGLRVVSSKNFSGAPFFVFWFTYLVDS